MAVDRMINETQGNDIIDKLSDIADNLDNVSVITPAKFGMGLATCNTAADVAAKTCNLANYVLTDGAPVSVKFTYANTASNPTLNINGTGAKPMYYKGTAMGTNVLTAGDIATFIYDVNGIYHIINIDTLAGPGAGTVTSVGATDGITTDQTSGTAIQGQGSVKLNLKSNSTYTGTVANPSTDVSIANGNVYPVALDGDGHPVVGVPWTDEGVKQTEVNTDASYELLFAKTTGTGEKTEGVSKSAKATMNPSTGAFTVNGEVSGAGFTGDGVKTSFASQTSDLSDKKVPSEKLVKTSLDAKVAGPSSVTGDTIVLFDSTTGKLVKSSSKTFESSYAISDDDNKIPTSKGIRENAATYGKLGTYSADTSRTNITDTTTIKGAVKQLEYREELNQSNILYGLQKVGTNIANVPEEQTVRSITFTRNSDGWITSNVSSDQAAWTVGNANITIPLEAKNYTFVWELSSDSNDDVELAVFMPSGTVLFNLSATTSNRKVTRAFTISSGDVGTYYIMYKTRTQKARLSVVETTVYNAYSEYQPYGAPNHSLTYLEAEDRAALAEEIDAGAKNLLQLPSGSATSYGITFSCDPNTGIVTANGTRQSGDCFMLLANISLTSFPRKFVAFCNNTDNTKVCITIIPHRTNGTYGSTIVIGTYTEIDLTNSAYDSFLIRAASYADTGTTLNNEKIYPMLCTKAVFDVSQKFVPYRPSYDTIASTYLTKCNTAVVNSGSLDDVSTNTIAYYSNNVSGLPSGVSGYAICETTVFDANVMVQKLYMIDGVYNAFIRMKQTGTWRAWKQITNT